MILLFCVSLFPLCAAQFGGCGFQRCGHAQYPQPQPLQQYQYQGHQSGHYQLTGHQQGGYALGGHQQGGHGGQQHGGHYEDHGRHDGSSSGYVTPPKYPFNLMDKDLTTSKPEIDQEYEKYEARLAELKPYTAAPIPIEEPLQQPINVSGITYIRELSPTHNYPRPMPYRPHPLLPRGCPVLPPQYLRPHPHMPRGYVTPLPYIHPPHPAPRILPQMVGPYPMPMPTAHYSMYQPPSNDCCGRCHSPCKYRRKVHAALAQGSKTVKNETGLEQETEEDRTPVNPRCSDKDLKEVMNKYTTRTAALSKRLIQKHAEEKLGGYFSVFCSSEDFSYLTRSEVFCQTLQNNIFCYAFQHF